MSKKSSETVTISKAEYESFKSLKEHCAQLESELKWLKEQLLINKKKALKKSANVPNAVKRWRSSARRSPNIWR